MNKNYLRNKDCQSRKDAKSPFKESGLHPTRAVRGVFYKRKLGWKGCRKTKYGYW